VIGGFLNPCQNDGIAWKESLPDVSIGKDGTDSSSSRIAFAVSKEFLEIP
jgi:hypothetical protein